MINTLQVDNPFPGLRSFEEEEEFLFFGRETQIDEILKRLRMSRFLAVVGSSGSGKSSLVKCGLLPSLHAGYMTSAGSQWRVALFRPGNNPIGNFADALSVDGILADPESDAGMQRSLIEITLRRHKLGLIETVTNAHLSPDDNLLIVVDQFEELFRFSRYENSIGDGKRDSIIFINLLLQAAQQRDVPIYIVLTMRSDFLEHCTEFRGLAEAINDGQYLIPRMTREERRMAIVGPVSVGGAQITSRLEVRLLNDMGENPDQLPILQHAMMRTWEYWKRNHKDGEPLDLEHYKAIGTMAEALSLHAEEAFAELPDEHTKHQCSKIFKALTEAGPANRGIRRPTKLSELAMLTESRIDDMISIIEVYRKPGRSFLMPPKSVKLNGESIIDISHESFMRVWTRLHSWVEEETNSAEIYMRLADAAAMYQQGKTGLWRDPDLQIALKWRFNNNPNQLWALRYDPSFDRAISFLDYSKQHYDFELAEKEKQRKIQIRRIKVFAAVLGLAFLVSIVLGINSLISEKNALASKKEAEEKRNEAITNQRKADSLRRIATINSSLAKAAQDSALHLRDVALKSQQQSERDKTAALIASDSARAAERRALAAEESATRALKERIKADSLAELSKTVAQIAKEGETILQLRAIAKAMAVTSIQRLNDNDTSGSLILALKSYYINREANNLLQGPENYMALEQLNRALRPDRFDQQFVKFDGKAFDVRSVEYSSTGDTIATAGDDGTCRLWYKNKMEKALLLQLQVLPAQIKAITFSPDGTYLVAGCVNGQLFRWRFSEKKMERISGYQTNGSLHSISFGPQRPDGSSLFMAGYADSIRIAAISRNQFQLLQHIPSNGSRFTTATLSTSPGETYLAVASTKADIRIWTLSRGAASIKEKPGITASYIPTAVSFSPTTSMLATGTMHGTVALYRVKDLVLTEHLPGHRSEITSLRFQKNGKVLASSSLDQSTRIWSLKNEHVTGEAYYLKEQKQWVRAADFHPNGSMLVTVGQNGLLHFWPIDLEALTKDLCRSVDTHAKRRIAMEYHDVTIPLKNSNCLE